MGYRIEYTNAGIKRKRLSPIRWRNIRIYVLIGIAVFGLFWWAKSHTQTVAALENMAQQVGSGMSVGEAFEAFCIDILQSAEGGVG